MIIKTWSIEREFGYKPITSFYTDFSIAEMTGGASAVADTYHRAMKEWKDNYKYLTELVMVLNWKMFEHNGKRNDLVELYNDLWGKADVYAQEHLKGEELSYFFATTD